MRDGATGFGQPYAGGAAESLSLVATSAAQDSAPSYLRGVAEDLVREIPWTRKHLWHHSNVSRSQR